MTLLIAIGLILCPLEPVPYTPHLDCADTIARIVQHETLHTQSPVVYRFVAEQVRYDLSRIPCRDLTRWRWAIGDYHPVLDKRVVRAVNGALLEPHLYSPCKYIGNPGDLRFWPGPLSVDYTFMSNGLTVIGVNCP